MNILNYFRHKHDWIGAGWGNEKGMEIKNILMLHFLCKCGERAFVYEPLKNIKRRFEGYRKKYGNSEVWDNEFGSPQPEDYKTVYMKNNNYVAKYHEKE